MDVLEPEKLKMKVFVIWGRSGGRAPEHQRSGILDVSGPEKLKCDACPPPPTPITAQASLHRGACVVASVGTGVRQSCFGVLIRAAIFDGRFVRPHVP